MGMGSREDALSFLGRLEKAKVETFLWKGTIRIDPKIHLKGAAEIEFMRLKPEIHAELVRRADLVRSQPGIAHKWLLKRGRKAAGRTVPGYMACGTQSWIQRCVKAATLFSVDLIERSLWIVLEPEWIGPIVRNANDVLVASYVKLPDGFGQAAPEGVEVEIAAACGTCLAPGAPPEETEKVVQGE
jgi:hypothetical protein